MSNTQYYSVDSFEKRYNYQSSPSISSYNISSVPSYTSYNYGSNYNYQVAPINSWQYNYHSLPSSTKSYSYYNNESNSYIHSNNSASNIANDLLSLAPSYSTNYAESRGTIYSSVYLSEIEQAILRAHNPLEISETELITVLGNRGLWVNRAEVNSWRGDLPISAYLINEDANPEIITKKVQQNLEYVQELAIRYLRPPTPPAPGEIIIRQQPNIPTAPAPPLIIRQQPARPVTPEPLIIREAPPQPPATVGRKIITIAGKRIPPPPRKVVIERLPQLPAKPQAVFIERWLPYAEQKRKVVFQPNQVPDPVVKNPRNLIIEWKSPDVKIRKELKYLGIARADPAEYVSRYGSSLKTVRQLPSEILQIRTPNGLVLASDYKYKQYNDLEGDIHALNLIDLSKEGLSHYSNYLGATRGLASYNYLNDNQQIYSTSLYSVQKLLDSLFNEIDFNNTGYISLEDAEIIISRLSKRLKRNYNESQIRSLFSNISLSSNGEVSLEAFRHLFLNFL